MKEQPNRRSALGVRTVLVALAVLHLSFSLFVNPPGYLTYDSGTYHFMVKTFAETGGFYVANGFEEFPSPELATAQLKIHSGRLVAQYPEMLTLLAQPFYLVLSYSGLFLINALAFLGTGVLVHKLALQLFGHRETALLSVIVYGLGTFAWEYSQSSYPHLSATFFVLWSVYLTALVVAEPTARRALAWAFGAGLALGVAVGMRLDSLFALPGVVLPLVFSRPLLYRQAFAVAAGLTPPMWVLSVINHQKFGTYMPLTYGRSGSGYTDDLGWYLPLTLLGLGGLAAIFAWQRLDPRRRPAVRNAAVLVALLAVAVRADVALDFVTRMASGTYQILVDMRIRDPTLSEPALSRSATGAMIYLKNVKKSLLQSCPYLVLLLLTLYDVSRRREHHRQLLFLFLAPASFIGFFSYLAWHGSIALNMRYLNPILPMTSIIAAYTWSRLAGGGPRGQAVRCFIYSFLLLFCSSYLVRETPALQEPFFLSVPLVIALVLLAGEICRRRGWLPRLSRGTGYLMLVAVAWGGAVTLGNDYPVMADHRRYHLVASQKLFPYIEEDSLIISTIPDICWGLIDRFDRLRIANPDNDDYRSFAELAEFHLRAGRRVYLALPPDVFIRELKSGRFGDFRIRRRGVGATIVLNELELPSPPAAG